MAGRGGEFSIRHLPARPAAGRGGSRIRTLRPMPAAKPPAAAPPAAAAGSPATTARPATAGPAAVARASARPRPAGDGTLHLSAALDGSQPLARLLERLQASRACFDAACELLPGPLRAQLRPGPIDDQGWTLLAANGATAAKLRQMLPMLQAQLRRRGHAVAAIRIRVQAG